MTTSEQIWPAAPAIARQRQEPRRRNLTVSRVERLGPHMIRFALTGSDLAGFSSAAPDDHIKVFLPVPGEKPAMRDYTPRAYDAARGELLLDFVDHPGGPAADWARVAQVGDSLSIGGPRGSQVIEAEQVVGWLLIGDETALPAIGRRIEEIGGSRPVTAIVAVPGPQDEQTFPTPANLRWLHRPLSQAADAAPFLNALADQPISPGTFIWIAAEGSVARALRAALIARGVPMGWIKAAGYWVQGQADASVKSFDEVAG